MYYVELTMVVFVILSVPPRILCSNSGARMYVDVDVCSKRYLPIQLYSIMCYFMRAGRGSYNYNTIQTYGLW
jgi:hypothetical protein